MSQKAETRRDSQENTIEQKKRDTDRILKETNAILSEIRSINEDTRRMLREKLDKK